MTNEQLNIILQLQDKASNQLQAVQAKVEKLGDSFKEVGRQVTQLGRNMTFFGAELTGPFVLAFKTATDHSLKARLVMNELQASFVSLQTTIGTAVIPVVEKITNLIAGLTNWFNSLNPKMRDTILQTTLMTGIFITLGGVLLSNIGKIATTIGVMANFAMVHPILLTIIAALALIVVYWDKIRSVAIPVINGLEMGLNILAAGVYRLGAFMTGLQEKFLDVGIALLQLQRALTPFGEKLNVFGPQIEQLKKLKGELDNARKAQDDLANAFTGKAVSISMGNTGDIVLTLDKVGQQIENFINSLLKKLPAALNLTKSGLAQLGSAFGQLSSALESASDMNKGFAKAAAATAMASAIVNTALAVTEALKVPPPWFGMTLAAMIGAAGAVQIATIASQKFATGTDNVPAMLSQGEMVIPRSFADAVRSGDIAVSGRGGASAGKQVINHISVEINYPNVRSEQDIDDITEKVSKRIALEAERL